MNPWLIIAVIGAGIVFLIDYLLRRKKWTDNTKTERTSLIVHMVSVPLYVFLSIFGLLWGIVAYSPDTAFGEALYDVTMTLGGYYWIIAAAAAIGSFIFRKIGKPKASIWINVIAFAYMAVLLGANSIAGKLL